MQKQTKPKKNVIFYRPKPFRYSKNCFFRIKIYLYLFHSYDSILFKY